MSTFTNPVTETSPEQCEPHEDPYKKYFGITIELPSYSGKYKYMNFSTYYHQTLSLYHGTALRVTFHLYNFWIEGPIPCLSTENHGVTVVNVKKITLPFNHVQNTIIMCSFIFGSSVTRFTKLYYLFI